MIRIFFDFAQLRSVIDFENSRAKFSANHKTNRNSLKYTFSRVLQRPRALALIPDWFDGWILCVLFVTGQIQAP